MANQAKDVEVKSLHFPVILLDNKCALPEKKQKYMCVHTSVTSW